MSSILSVKKLLLLSSVCVWSFGLPQHAQARLLPEMPSVEVHFEALEALRYSVQAQRQGAPSGWDVGPAGKIHSAPVGYPEPAPAAPVPPAPVTVARPAPAPIPAPQVAKAAPEFKPVVTPKPRPEPEVAKASPPAPPPPTQPEPPKQQEVRKTPAQQPPKASPEPKSVEVVREAPPKVEPEALALPPLPGEEEEQKKAPPLDLASLAPLEPLEPQQSLDAAQSLEKELENLPSLSPAEDVMPPMSADLPEPDMGTLEPLPPMPETKEPEKETEKAEKAEKKESARAEEDSAPSMNKIVIKAPDAPEVPSLEELGLPEMEDTAVMNDAQLPPLPGEDTPTESVAPSVSPEEIPEGQPLLDLPQPEMDASEPPAEEAMPDLAVPDAMPPFEGGEGLAALEDEEPPAPAPAPAAKEEKGMFSGISGMLSGMLGGDDEEKKAPPPAPAAEEAPPPAEEEMAALPPLDAGLPSLETAPAESGLPPLPDEPPVPSADALPSLDAVTSGPGSEEDALSFVKGKTEGGMPLPPIGKEELPPLSLNEKEAAPEVPVSDALPPLPPSDEEELPSLEKELAAIPAPLPPQESPLQLSVDKPDKPALEIDFAKTETEVPLSSHKPLQDLAKKLTAPGNMSGVSVVAYASGSEDQASIARRVSLSRALAVRAFLIDAGVDNLRINVQAMGNKAEGGNPERAEIFIK